MAAELGYEMQRLDDGVVRRITSAQVATGVRSIVKELVENALDAGADALEIRLKQAGLRSIIVRDNGCGIPETGAEFMAQRYYTSKIRRFEDLENVATLGFRGEALASIAEMSELTIRTALEGEQLARIYQVVATGTATLSAREPSSCSGTLVTVSDVFHNMPVRKRVAEAPKTRKAEVAAVQEMLQGYGLARPDLRIVFHCDVQPTIAWSKAPAASQKQAVAAFFGAPLARALQDIEFAMPLSSNDVDRDEEEEELPPVRVQGLVPQPGATLQVIGRTTGDRYFIFVNGRPVQLPEVAKAARRAWRQGEKTRYHPFVYLDITVPRGSLDVNVNPDKSTVLFENESDLATAVFEAISKVYNTAARVDSTISQAKAAPSQVQLVGGKLVVRTATSKTDTLHEDAVSAEPAALSATSTVTSPSVQMDPPAAPHNETSAAAAAAAQTGEAQNALQQSLLPNAPAPGPAALPGSRRRDRLGARADEGLRSLDAFVLRQSQESIRSGLAEGALDMHGANKEAAGVGSARGASVNKISEKSCEGDGDQAEKHEVRAEVQPAGSAWGSSPQAVEQGNTGIEDATAAPRATSRNTPCPSVSEAGAIAATVVASRGADTRHDDALVQEESCLPLLTQSAFPMQRLSRQRMKRSASEAHAEEAEGATGLPYVTSTPTAAASPSLKQPALMSPGRSRALRPRHCCRSPGNGRLAANTEEKTAAQMRYTLVGRLLPSSIWIIADRELKLAAFDSVRALEAKLYHRLMSQNTISSVAHEPPLELKPTALGHKAWTTLLGLERSLSALQLPGVYEITSSVVLANGFHIELRFQGPAETTEPRALLTGMPVAPAMTTKDLREILEKEEAMPKSSIAATRPAAAKRYFANEAQRLAGNAASDLPEKVMALFFDHIEQKYEFPKPCLHWILREDLK